MKKFIISEEEKSEILKQHSSINENEPINKNSNTNLRLVNVNYGGKNMKAVAIGFSSGPYYKEVYHLIDDNQFDNSDFDNVEPLDPSELILK
jgi:hypothetical protein